MFKRSSYSVIRTESPIRIAFVITGLSLGGAETQLVRLVSRLNRAKWEPLVLSLRRRDYFADELYAAGVPVTFLEARGAGSASLALVRAVRLLRRWRPEVLVSFMWHANIFGRLAARAAGVPVVVTSIRNENFGGRLRPLLFRATNLLCDGATANAEAVANAMVRRGIVPAHKMHVTPNALARGNGDWSAARPDVRREIGAAPADFVWLAVGRLEGQKDYSGLLRAMAMVTADGPFRLVIVGDGTQRTKLEALAAALGVANRVAFLGARRDVGRLLAAADGFVLASAWEGLPNCVMEAMAAGRSVVATSVGGVSELIADGSIGVLVAPRDPAALARALAAVMAMPEPLRRQMGEAAQRAVSRDYGLDQVVATWERLFLSLLASKGLVPSWSRAAVPAEATKGA